MIMWLCRQNWKWSGRMQDSATLVSFRVGAETTRMRLGSAYTLITDHRMEAMIRRIRSTKTAIESEILEESSKLLTFMTTLAANAWTDTAVTALLLERMRALTKLQAEATDNKTKLVQLEETVGVLGPILDVSDVRPLLPPANKLASAQLSAHCTFAGLFFRTTRCRGRPVRVHAAMCDALGVHK